MTNGELPMVTWEKIIEHIDHAVKVAGADHVGLGSDFDGATMPIGMEDVSKLPKITDALLKKGYSEADIEKILGGNILRVMEQVEKVKGSLTGFGVQGSRVQGSFLVPGSGVLGSRVRGSRVLGSRVRGSRARSSVGLHDSEILMQPRACADGSVGQLEERGVLLWS